ncbi:MAG: hypothetical protein LN410_04000 [Candidatus Thermoplasmatota archaeon]|nr:hypothetical protein [Candidatus Thermoplasmatota archaeon]
MLQLIEPLPFLAFALSFTSSVYLAVGVVLAYFGRAIWGRLMTLVGLILGGSVGYQFGVLLIPGFGGIALAVVGALLGAMAFTWLVEVALAGMAGFLGLYVSYRSFVDLGVLEPSLALIAGLVIMLVVFSFAFYYMDRIMSYVTALVGAVLAGVGLFLMTNELTLSVSAAIGVGVSGAVVQELLVKPYVARFKKAPRSAAQPRKE